MRNHAVLPGRPPHTAVRLKPTLGITGRKGRLSAREQQPHVWDVLHYRHQRSRGFAVRAGRVTDQLALERMATRQKPRKFPFVHKRG